MSLVYRAIWQDSLPQLCDVVHRCFTDWVDDRSSGGLVPTEPGDYTATVDGLGDLDVQVESATGENGAIHTYRASYILTTEAGERWHTVVRAWNDLAGGAAADTADGHDPARGWCWVDNSVVGDGLSFARPLAIKAPKLARDLIDAGRDPRVGEVRLHSDPVSYSGAAGAEELAALVTSFERSVPVVVFAEDPARFAEYGGTFDYDRIPADTARDLAGIAVIARADREAVAALTGMWGRDFAVFDGAMRVYAPGVDPAVVTDSFHHRYVTADNYMGAPNLAGAIAGRIAGPASTLRRPPAVYETVKKNLTRSGTLAGVGVADEAQFWQALAEETEDSLDHARNEVLELRGEQARLLEDRDELEAVRRELIHAKRLLITRRVYDDFTGDGRGGFRRRQPQTAQETVEMVEDYLCERVEIHPDALVDAAVMDRAAEGAEWAQTAWEGFQALYAYAEDRAKNPDQVSDFHSWCTGPRNTVGWPGNKSARGESGTTKSQNKGTRLFPCSVKLARDRQIEMVAHLKIKIQGGANIPRIYFLYSERTDKVHVGFYGPHGRVPNTKTRKM